MLTPELHLQGMKPELVNCGSKLKGVKSEPTYVQTVKDTGINHGAESQFVGFSKQASDSKVYRVVPSELNARSQKRDRKSHKLSQKQQLQKIKQKAFRDEPHLQHIKSSELCTKLQDLKSMEFNSEQQLQDVMSSVLGLGISPQSLDVNLGPHLQETKSFEVCTETKLPDEPSQEFKHKPTLQGMKFSELNSGTGIQREMSIIVNKGQPVQDLKFESTPGSNIIDVAPVEYNLGPQVQSVIFSELNPGLKLQCINPAKLSSGPQWQNVKSFELNPGPESQCPKSVLLKFGPPFQDVMSSHLMVGAEFQEIPFLKNQLGSWLQTAHPVFTLRPPSNGVKSVGVSPTPLPEDRMSPEMSKQPLLCLTNSVKVTPGCSRQDLRSKEFSPEPCFQKVKSVKLKPGSPTPSVNPLEFAPCHCSQRTKTSFALKPCVHERESMQLRLGSRQQSMDCQQFPLNEKPVVSTPESTGNFLAGPALSSVKFSNLIPESQQQCMKLTEFTSEPKWQSVNHVKLSSVSLPQTGTSVGSSRRPFLQNVTPGNQNPQTRDQIIESSQVIYKPGHQLEDCAEKMSRQVSKLVDFISLPVSQDAEFSEMKKSWNIKAQKQQRNL
ncbi:uncharacterized protein LOC119086454 [Peromyscus leucopus]|uniref:uncharacterized protein LOC119086454 n=1 Tax=Peromyscus leucopus TaxID=10041 RepID=UPI001884D243|nr:uncharacterized protein LOC119086454 [Peromyscus leucopus]